jgi:hypothetical protein
MTNISTYRHRVSRRGRAHDDISHDQMRKAHTRRIRGIGAARSERLKQRVEIERRRLLVPRIHWRLRAAKQRLGQATGASRFGRAQRGVQLEDAHERQHAELVARAISEVRALDRLEIEPTQRREAVGIGQGERERTPRISGGKSRETRAGSDRRDRTVRRIGRGRSGAEKRENAAQTRVGQCRDAIHTRVRKRKERCSSCLDGIVK